jgi:hypothetical protein
VTAAATAAGFDHLDGKIEALQISTIISATKLANSDKCASVGRYNFVGRVKFSILTAGKSGKNVIRVILVMTG